MGQRIRRFAVAQTAKVFGVLYLILGLIFLPFFLIFDSLSADGPPIGTGLAIALPLLYGLFGFVSAAIGCAIYNLVAGWTGGIEIELADGTGDG